MASPHVETLHSLWEAVQAEAGPHPVPFNVFVAHHCADVPPEVVQELCARVSQLRSADALVRAAGLDSQPSAGAGGGPNDGGAAPGPPAGFALPPGYCLVRRLGRGGCGEVYQATAPGGLPVALKFVSLGQRLGEMEKRAFELMKDIRHPHLLGFSGAWEDDERLVVALELAEGSLLDRLRQEREKGRDGLPPAELLKHTADAAAALDYLHAPRQLGQGGQVAGLQHRDIKPENLLLVGGRVKVADFGLVRLVEHSLTSHTGAMSCAYAAPEFFRNQTSLHSDQYSLAVTYCELRGGRRPFEGSLADLMKGHLADKPNLSMLSSWELAAVGRALAKDPLQRWPSCSAFAEALKASAPLPAALPTAPGPSPGVASLPPPPAAVWYFFAHGGRQGLFTTAQVQQMLVAGRLGPADYIWRPGLSGWTPASGVPELARFAVPPPRPAPTSPVEVAAGKPPVPPPAKEEGLAPLGAAETAPEDGAAAAPTGPTPFVAPAPKALPTAPGPAPRAPPPPWKGWEPRPQDVPNAAQEAADSGPLKGVGTSAAHKPNAAQEAPGVGPGSPPAQPGAPAWVVKAPGGRKGPLTTAQVQQMLVTGRIGPATLVWRYGLADWSPASGLPELARFAAPPLPPAPTGPVEVAAGKPLAPPTKGEASAATTGPTPFVGSPPAQPPVKVEISQPPEGPGANHLRGGPSPTAVPQPPTAKSKEAEGWEAALGCLGIGVVIVVLIFACGGLMDGCGKETNNAAQPGAGPPPDQPANPPAGKAKEPPRRRWFGR